MDKRKRNRLQDYDYGKSGGYFNTFCTHNQEWTLCEIIPNKRSELLPPDVALSSIGKITEQAIEEYFCDNDDLELYAYVIMPNHVHIAYVVLEDFKTNKMAQVVANIKSFVNKAVGKDVWQRSFHDHVIRDEKDKDRILKYIKNNPMKWELDKFNNP